VTLGRRWLALDLSAAEQVFKPAPHPAIDATRFNKKIAGTLRAPSANSDVFKAFGTWKVPFTF